MLKDIYSALSAFHPIAPWALLTLAIWLLVYAVRRWLPSLWLPLTRWPTEDGPVSLAIQGLPSVVLGAAWAGLALGDPWGAVYGAVAGALAPFWHHLLKSLPVPYQGLLRDAGTRWSKATKNAGLSSLVLGVLLFSGCAVPLESARRDGLLGAPPSSLDRCSSLDDSRTFWGAVAKGAAVAAGASGVAAIPLDDQEARIAAASVAAGAAVVGAVAVYVSESKDESWARECSSR